MPRYKRKNYKRKYKRRYKKRSSNSFAVASSSPRLPLPNKLKTTFRYVEDVSLGSVTLGTASSYVFSANGMYDPNISQTGHQPLGFDQMMLFYQHYTVIGSKIKVTYTSTTNNEPVIVGIQLRDSATVITDPDEGRENGNLTYKIIGTEQGSHSTTLFKSFSPKNFFGKKVTLSNSEFYGTTSGNPTEQAYYHLTVGAYQPSAVVPTIYMNVQVEYLAVLTEPRILAQS